MTIVINDNDVHDNQDDGDYDDTYNGGMCVSCNEKVTSSPVYGEIAFPYAQARSEA